MTTHTVFMEFEWCSGWCEEYYIYVQCTQSCLGFFGG